MALHVVWYNAALHLFADRLAEPRWLPAEELRALLGDLTPDDTLLAPVARETMLSVFLPHDERGAIPCEEIGGSVGRSAEENVRGLTYLAPVDVPALALNAEQAIDLLTTLGSPVPEVCGDSVNYFAELMRFVLERIAARQFFPDLEQPRALEYVAKWRLLVHTEADLRHLEKFAAAMPAVCRAVAADDAADASRIIDSFLGETVDAFIRRAVKSDEFFLRPQQLAQTPATATPDVRWLAALLSENPAVAGKADENTFLFEHVRAWVAKLDEGRANAPWQLQFELEEPDFGPEEDESAEANTEAMWTLKLQLKSPGEEGEIVDAADVWSESPDPTGLFGRGISDRRAQLVADVARATEICPLLARLLESPTPSEAALSTPEAHAFIRQWATPLQEQNFPVALPEWATRRERNLGLLLSVRPSGGEEFPFGFEGQPDGSRSGESGEYSPGKFGLESLLDFDWQIAVGDLRLTPAEFTNLASRGTPLVRYKGRWLQFEPDAAQKTAAFLEKHSAGKMTLAEAFRTAYGVTKTDAGLPVIGLSGAEWIDRLLKPVDAVEISKLEQPPGFKGTLRPYQLRGLEWLCFLERIGLGACLADDMGLGKTIQLIALLVQERTGKDELNPLPSPGPSLLFAPTSVVGNWLRELSRFAPQLKVLLHHGPDRLGGDDFVAAANGVDVVLTTYALAHRDVVDLRRPNWHRIALDEAQKIKNPSAAGSIAIRSIPAPRRIAMTGTPVENHLAELWSIMELLNPGLLGSASDFRERFAVPIEKLGDRDRAFQLRRMIQPFILRRTKSDPTIASDLPEKMEMKVFCNLTPEQAAMYERITTDMLGQIDAATGIRRRGLILAALTRLKQICDHPILLEKHEPAVAARNMGLNNRSGKCERLVEMLEEVLEEGDGALIFTQYREMGHHLERLIAERLRTPTLFLHGGTPARQRDTMIEQFQAPNSNVKLFLLSLRAGGLGLNLTAANHVFHFDRWWNPAVEAQATDRAHRIGQTKKVQVHQFICVGTLEERIDKLLTDKLALAGQVVGAGDEWLTNLSTDQLRQYLSLSRDAVGEF